MKTEMMTFKATVHAADKDYVFTIKAPTVKAAFRKAKQLGKKHEDSYFKNLYSMKVKVGKTFRSVR